MSTGPVELTRVTGAIAALARCPLPVISSGQVPSDRGADAREVEEVLLPLVALPGGTRRSSLDELAGTLRDALTPLEGPERAFLLSLYGISSGNGDAECSRFEGDADHHKVARLWLQVLDLPAAGPNVGAADLAVALPPPSEEATLLSSHTAVSREYRLPRQMPRRRPPRRVRVVAVGVAAATAAALTATVGAMRDRPRESSVTTEQLVADLVSARTRQEREHRARMLAERADPEGVARLATRSSQDPAAAEGLLLVRQRLISMYRSPPYATDPGRRRAVVLSLASTGDEVAARTVAEALASDTDADVRGVAAAELRRTPFAGAVAQELVQRRPADGLRGPEIDAVLVALGASALPSLYPLLATKTWAVDVAVAIGPAAVNELSERLTRSLGARPDVAAIRALRRIDRAHSGAASALWPPVVEALMRAPEGVASFDALAEIGEPAVAPLVAVARQSTQGIPTEEVLRIARAGFALEAIGRKEPSALDSLFASAENDLRLPADLDNLFIRLGKPGSERLLIDALESLGNERSEATIMFFALYSSGNPNLVEGARQWATRRGITISGEPAARGPWGTAGVFPASPPS